MQFVANDKEFVNNYMQSASSDYKFITDYMSFMAYNAYISISHLKGKDAKTTNKSL